MFLAVLNLLAWLDMALNFDAVPMRPLDADDISFGPKFVPPRLDIGRLDVGREMSISRSK